MGSSDIAFERKCMFLNYPSCLKCGAPKRHNYTRVDSGNLPLQVYSTVAKDSLRWRGVVPVGIPRVTQDGIGDKNLPSRKPAQFKQMLKVVACSVAVEGDCGSVCSEATRSFPNKHDFCVMLAIGPRKHASAALHFGATSAGLYIRD
jgi:hypothetical protein